MSYLLIPVKEGSATSDSDLMMPGFIMQLISAIILSVVATSKWLPDLHGWGRFGLCALAVVIVLILSMLPKIGAVICIANGIAWIVVLWMLVGGISILWLNWTLRIIAILLVAAFESIPVMNSLC